MTFDTSGLIAYVNGEYKPRRARRPSRSSTTASCTATASSRACGCSTAGCSGAELHMARIARSARTLGLGDAGRHRQDRRDHRRGRAPQRAAATRTCARSSRAASAARASTRGCAPCRRMIVSAYPFPPFLGADPIKLFTSAIVRKAPRSLGAHVKSLNYLDAIVAKQQAGELGVHDAVMLDSLGAVAECTGANLFIVVGDTLVTPTTRAALPGHHAPHGARDRRRAGHRGRRARHLADGAARRRRRVRVRLGRGDRPDRLLRRAPGDAARAPADRRIQEAYRERTRSTHYRTELYVGRLNRSTLAAMRVLGHGAGAVRAASRRGRIRPSGIDVARALAQRDSLIHGIAGDERYVFVTEPGMGVEHRRSARRRARPLHRPRGRRAARRRPAASSSRSPLAVPQTGHLVVLDAGGFPPQGPPMVYDYRYRPRPARLRAPSWCARSTSPALPLGVRRGRRGAAERRVRRLGVGRSAGCGWSAATARCARDRDRDPTARRRCPNLSGVPVPASRRTSRIGGLPFEALGGFAPGAGSLAVRGDDLYLSSTCQGGIQKVKIKTLLDSSRPAAERAAEIETVAPRAQYAAREPEGHHVQPVRPRRPVDLRR